MAIEENVKLRKRNFAVNQGYFFTFDEDQDNLQQKTDDGNTAFSYPLDTLISNEVVSTEFDGVYFWTLENPGDTNIYIKRWEIDNYLCKLRETFTVTSGTHGGLEHYFDSNAFSVAHYHTELSAPVSSGASSISVDGYASRADLMGFTTTSGDPLIIHLGPNSNDEEEDVYVTSASGTTITISGATQYSYSVNDSVNFYTYLWFFNNYNGLDSSTGALYKFDAYTGDYIKKYPGGAYKAVQAATFYEVDSFTEFGDVDTLAYVKNTNTLFINIDSLETLLPHYGSMVMENIKSDEATVIDVYDLAMDSQNVYRLQKIADGESSPWSYYSYLLSSLDSFVTSISLSAYPAIIAANGISSSTIVAYVKDQFLQPITSRNVTFTDDDPVGYITTGVVSTDSNGRAQTNYKSGTSAREVKITAVVEQT